MWLTETSETLQIKHSKGSCVSRKSRSTSRRHPLESWLFMSTEKYWIFAGRSKKLRFNCNLHFISETKLLTFHWSMPKLCMQYFLTVSLSLSLLVFVCVLWRTVKQRAFFGFFTPSSHAARSLPGFMVDNHKIFLMVVVGGCWGVRVGLTGGVKSHRLSGQISPYCEKKRHWLCAYCAPMFKTVIKIVFPFLPSRETKGRPILLSQREKCQSIWLFASTVTCRIMFNQLNLPKLAASANRKLTETIGTWTLWLEFNLQITKSFNTILNQLPLENLRD